MKKIVVTFLALTMAFGFCACGGKKGDDSDKAPVGIPLTAEDEQKVEGVIDQIDYVLDAMPDLDDIMGTTVQAAATGDVDTLRSVQQMLAPLAEETEDKSVTFGFDIKSQIIAGTMDTRMKIGGFFKITEDALYAEYTDTETYMAMSMKVDGQTYNTISKVRMPFKLYIDAEEVYIYYDAFDMVGTVNGVPYETSLTGTTGRWIDINKGYFSDDLAEAFEEAFMMIADGMRTSLVSLRDFFNENVEGKLSNVDGVYVLKEDMMDDYYAAYSEAQEDSTIPDDSGMISLYDTDVVIKFDVRDPDKPVVEEYVSAEADFSEIAPELIDLVGGASFSVKMKGILSFYDINNTTIEKPTNVGSW